MQGAVTNDRSGFLALVVVAICEGGEPKSEVVVVEPVLSLVYLSVAVGRARQWSSTAAPRATSASGLLQLATACARNTRSAPNHPRELTRCAVSVTFRVRGDIDMRQSKHVRPRRCLHVDDPGREEERGPTMPARLSPLKPASPPGPPLPQSEADPARNSLGRAALQCRPCEPCPLRRRPTLPAGPSGCRQSTRGQSWH